ncbi:hypothetical protein V5E97_09885 [Singulisphaera sp. Ch08]|uniref:Uncharacterized protein n=1 Tax=Singulisphaera sp. Ch08 TaxID=3120278 RepID=A0AAU7CM40_9BACT
MPESKELIAFMMGAKDLDFLVWAMDFLKGGPHDEEKRIAYWEDQFVDAMAKHFPDFEPGEDVG